MSVRFINVELKPMPECQFCGYPLIKEYLEDEDGYCFCKQLCVREYHQKESEGEKLSNIIVRIKSL